MCTLLNLQFYKIPLQNMFGEINSANLRLKFVKI